MPDKFKVVIEKIKNLQLHEKYESALIFGSLARNDFNAESDVDVIIITNSDYDNTIIHPYINNIKLDLSYYSFKQLKETYGNNLDNLEREPLIARSKILFDKTGNLTEFVEQLNKVQPKKWTAEVEANKRFLMYHANDKVSKNIEKDPISAMFSMHCEINDLLKVHYLINQKWWLSSKKLLADLKTWDSQMYLLLENFLVTTDVKKKYNYWTEIYNYILDQIGGFKSLEENIPETFLDDVKLLNI